MEAGYFDVEQIVEFTRTAVYFYKCENYKNKHKDVDFMVDIYTGLLANCMLNIWTNKPICDCKNPWNNPQCDHSFKYQYLMSDMFPTVQTKQQAQEYIALITNMSRHQCHCLTHSKLVEMEPTHGLGLKQLMLG